MFQKIILAAIIIMVTQATAYATVTCPGKPVGKVNVIWGSDNIEYDFTKSQAQMDAMETDTQNPYDRNVKTHVGGLMKGGISINSQVNVATLTYPRTKEICQWINKMDVNIRIDPKIYIAREHARGTCRHNAILDHEMKHIFIDREIVKKYVPKIRRTLEQAVLKVGIVGPKAKRDEKYYQDQITEYMDNSLESISEKMYAERNVQQQGVDTLEEYERVAKMCR